MNKKRDLLQTSFRIERDLKNALEMKKESNTEIINKAIKFYLKEFDLDEKIKEAEFKKETYERRIKELKEIKKNLEEDESKSPDELEDRDILIELIDKLGWSDVYDKNHCIEKLQDLSDSTLRIHADELGVDVNQLVKEINKYIENGRGE